MCVVLYKVEALSFFGTAGEYHRQRWPDSGFNNPAFIAFHQRLIDNGYDTRKIELVKVTAGKVILAVMYNLMAEDQVYFYLQGVNYDLPSKTRPGLVAQSAVIAHYLEDNKSCYDLMGGHSQYKQQIARSTIRFRSIVIQKNKFSFKIENLLRQARRFYRSYIHA